ncbi:hypothetical protein CCX46_27815 [Pseudomonas sp. RU47]|uniref:hypothetical protein n=1 Tax=Pseudomonas sp. RU47 TaxID=2005388 RepID=UPI000FDD87FB|nr:hypothetical protein [Pseudomonas sp. RU47]AZZ78777.1 hypothetical protein CCX46_27815 [Pseudomonas sp. RU47]
MPRDERTNADAVGKVYLSLKTFEGEEFTYSVVGREFFFRDGDHFHFKAYFDLGGHNFYIGSQIKMNAATNVAHKLGELGTVAFAHLELDRNDNDKQAEGIIYLTKNGPYPQGVLSWYKDGAFSISAVFDFSET